MAAYAAAALRRGAVGPAMLAVRVSAMSSGRWASRNRRRDTISWGTNEMFNEKFLNVRRGQVELSTREGFGVFR